MSQLLYETLLFLGAGLSSWFTTLSTAFLILGIKLSD